MATQNGGKRGPMATSGYKFCQERQIIAPLATGFGPGVPQIARAEPVNCQPKGLKHPNSQQEIDGKTGKITQNRKKWLVPNRW
jgi:hypothetical protein